MKKTKLFLFMALGVLLAACASNAQPQVAATTLPLYQFTAAICENTPIKVNRLVTESVSCLHDYSLTVGQMKAIEGSQVVVVSGAGLEEFMEESLENAACIIDASADISLLAGGHHHDDHAHEEHDGHDEHHGETDPHIWLSPINAITMAKNICAGLSLQYPEYETDFKANLEKLTADLEALNQYAATQLQELSCRDIITFHDGFGYLADAYHLNILEAIEEESGSEASAEELKHLIELVKEHHLPAIFTETNGSASAASIISSETGAAVYSLDMAMSGDDYFASMYHNIDTLKEALQS